MHPSRMTFLFRARRQSCPRLGLAFGLLAASCGRVDSTTSPTPVQAGNCDALPACNTEDMRIGAPAVELLELPEGFHSCDPRASSADGSTVVGLCSDSDGDVHSVKWTRGAHVKVLDVDGATIANGVSADGSVIVGEIADEGGYRYGDAVRDHFELPLFEVSDDASIVVAIGVEQRGDPNSVYAARGRSGQTNLERLEPLEPGLATWVGDLSGDGRIAVGFVNDRNDMGHAAFWSDSGSPQLLADFPGAVYSLAQAANRDGSVIVGTAYLDDKFNVGIPVRWTSAGAERLGTFPGIGLDVSADGRRILIQISAPDQREVIWEVGEIHVLRDVFSPADFGRSAAESLAFGLGVYGISSDGQSIFGMSSQAFVARLPF